MWKCIFLLLSRRLDYWITVFFWIDFQEDRKPETFMLLSPPSHQFKTRHTFIATHVLRFAKTKTQNGLATVFDKNEDSWRKRTAERPILKYEVICVTRCVDSDGSLLGRILLCPVWYTRTRLLRQCVSSLRQNTGRSPNHSFRSPFSLIFPVVFA